jgi:hypothetical protein
MKKTLLLAGVAALAAVGCAPPKILVGHAYASSNKSIETLIVKSGATVGTGSDAKNLFNVYMRVCDQDANNNTTGCKDTLILANVNPESI